VSIQNNRQNYCYVYFNLNVSTQQTRQKIPQHTAADISQIKSACYEKLNIKHYTFCETWMLQKHVSHIHCYCKELVTVNMHVNWKYVKNMWQGGRYILAYRVQADNKQYILRFTNSLAYLLSTLSPANKNSPHSWWQKSETKSRRKIHIQ